MKVLVTGGTGYIGSHICVALLKMKYTVIIVDNLCNSKIEVVDKIKQITNNQNIYFYNIDMTDKKSLEEPFKKHKIKGIIHCAGYKAVGESIQNPLLYYKNNVLSTILLGELMIKYNVKKIVFSSSATVYGNNISPLNENMELLPTTNPYGETKVINEKILKDLYTANNELSITFLRYFNPVGAHESGLIGENPTGKPNNLMPYISQTASGKLSYLSVFGNDYPTYDGTGIRDYIHVMDLAEGHVVSLQKIKKGIKIYNIGTGKGTSVLELIQTFEKVNNLKVPFKITERRSGDLSTCFADVSKINEELGWFAKRSIEEMCIDTWNHEQKKKDEKN